MSGMVRVKVQWSGFVGGPGYSIFHMREFSAGNEPTLAIAQAAVDKVHAAFTPLLPFIPEVVTVKVEGDVEVIEETNGQMQNVFGVTAPTPRVGTASNAYGYSAASGGVVNWRTGGVRNGRRVRGKTFIVPLNGNSYDGTGSLTPGSHAALQQFGATLSNATTDADLGVWARPTGPGATDGFWTLCTSFNAPDMAAVLRSRRN